MRHTDWRETGIKAAWILVFLSGGLLLDAPHGRRGAFAECENEEIQVNINTFDGEEYWCRQNDVVIGIFGVDPDCCPEKVIEVDMEYEIDWGDGTIYEEDKDSAYANFHCHTYSATGEYTIDYTALNPENECSDDDNKEKSVSVYIYNTTGITVQSEEPPAEITAGESILIEVGVDPADYAENVDFAGSIFIKVPADDEDIRDGTGVLVSSPNGNDSWLEVSSIEFSAVGGHLFNAKIAGEYLVDVTAECPCPYCDPCQDYGEDCEDCGGGVSCEGGGCKGGCHLTAQFTVSGCDPCQLADGGIGFSGGGDVCARYTGSPGVLYDSGDRYESEYSVRPFGTGGDLGNWRLAYDSQAIRDSTSCRLYLLNNGKYSTFFLETQSNSDAYVSPFSDATAEYSAGSGITIGYPSGGYVKYGNAEGSPSHRFFITESKGQYGDETEYEYDTSDRLTKVAEKPEDLSWELSWDGGGKLEYVESPAGVKTSFVLDATQVTRVTRSVGSDTFWRADLSYNGSGVPTKAERVDPDSPTTKMAGRELILSGSGTVIRADTLYGGSHVSSSTPVFSISGWNVGSSSRQYPDGTYTARLISTIWGATEALYKKVVNERRDASYSLISSSTQAYDVARNLLQEATSVLGATTAYVYEYEDVEDSTSENLLRVTDSDGNYSGYVYDEEDRVTRAYVYGGIEDTTLSISQSEYDSEDRLITSYVYDEANSATLAENRSEYDSSTGRLSATVDGENRRSSFEYDTKGRLWKVGIGDATTTTEYDFLGRRTRSVSPLGRITDYGYVATGNLVSVTQYLVVSGATSEVVTSYTYDYSGYGSNLLRVTDAEGYATSYGYGDFDRLATETLHSGTSADPPESATRYYYYDTLGRMTRKLDYRDWETEQGYDSLGRLSWTKYSDASEVLQASLCYSYNGIGQLEEIEYYGCDCGSPNETIEYEYGETTGRMVSRTDILGGTIGYSYDGAGRLSVLTYPKTWNADGGSPTPIPMAREWVYDLANRIVAVQESTAGTPTPMVEYGYSRASQVTSATFDLEGASENVVAGYTYDATGHLSEIAYKIDGVTTVLSLGYGYDLEGLRTCVTREAACSFATVEYSYDTLNRLTEEQALDDSGSTVFRRGEIRGQTTQFV